MQQVKLQPFDLFISDLHLCPSRPHITQSFITFLATTATKARALYILGDFFEYWAGDDDIAHPSHQPIIQALHALSQHGTALNIMHGNRDFLLGDAFCRATGATLLSDPTLLNLYGKRVLLSHGDDLCTDDLAYMHFRAEVRKPAWISQFLSQPLASRKAYIESVRHRSEAEKSTKADSIMDVNIDAVHTLLARYDYPDWFIHGHTHRPNTHTHLVANHVSVRHVLGDWYAQGSFLKCSAEGYENVHLS